MSGAWERYWFAPASLTRLAAFRVAILVIALWDVLGYARLVFPDAAAVSAGGPLRPWRPIYVFEVLGLQPIGTETAQAIFALLLVAIGLGLVGLVTRTACLVVAVLAFYWTGLAYSFGKPHHDKVALIFALWALPLAPVGARLSLDALLRARRRPAEAAPAQAPLATLPLRLTQLTVAIGYGAAGASKALLGGTDWLNGYTQQGILMTHDSDWSLWFSQSLFACQVSSVATVLSQLTFPLVLLFPLLRWYHLPVMTVIHLVTWKTMDTGPYFALWGVMLAAFVPLEQVPKTLSRWLTRGPLALRIVVAVATAGLALLLAVVLAINLAP
jgi:hypothetical protein